METIRSDTIGTSPRKYSYAWILLWLLKHPKTILCTILLITIILGLQIPNLVLRFSIYDLLAEGAPGPQTFQSFQGDLKLSASKENISLTNYYFEKQIRQNFLFFPPLIFSFIAIFSLLLLRKAVYISLILAGIALTQIWTLGGIAFLGLPLTHLSFIALIFLMSVQTVCGLHVAAICLNGSKDAATTYEAVLISFARVPLPLILSLIVIQFSLLSYIFNPVDTINQFGIYAATGMFSFTLLMLSFFPLGLSLFPVSLLKNDNEKEQNTGWTTRWTKFISTNQHCRRYVLPIFAVISIFSLIGLIRIGAEPNIMNYLIPNIDHIETQADPYLLLKAGASGIEMKLAESNANLIYGEIKSLVIALIMVFGIFWFLLISIKVGLIAIIPTIFPILFTLGAMGWLDVPYNIFTPLISTICIGFAAVNVIHFIVCCNHELKKDLNRHRAIKAALNLSGVPITNGAIVIGLSFSTLCFSNFSPIFFFGVMMVLTAFGTVVANLFIVPVFLQKVELVTIWDLLHLKLTQQQPNENIPLFKGLVSHQIHSILMAGNLQRLTPKEILFSKGDMSDTMYAIISGSLDIINVRRYEDDTGVQESQKVIKRLQAGDVVGEMGFFRSKRRPATVIAMEKTELLQINWQMIRRLQWLYPVTAQKFFINLMGIVCDRLESITRILSDQSLIDDLTGLFNKKGFTQLLETETNRAQRYHEELTLCLIGLDLKESVSINNPEAAEVMIRTVCQMLSREIRRTDILSRIDNTTFAMVAPKTSQTQAGILCKRLREVLHRNLLGFGSPALKIRLTAANMIYGSKETGIDLLERSLALLHNAQE